MAEGMASQMSENISEPMPVKITLGKCQRMQMPNQVSKYTWAKTCRATCQMYMSEFTSDKISENVPSHRMDVNISGKT